MVAGWSRLPEDNTLKVWDLKSGRKLCTLTGHSDIVLRVAVTPDGRRAVSASQDRTLKVWDLESGRELYTLTGHYDWINGMAVTPDGRRVVSASKDNTLKVWDLESGQELCLLNRSFGSGLWGGGNPGWSPGGLGFR